MSWWNPFSKRAEHAATPTPVPTGGYVGEVAWADSLIGYKNWPKYNPDELVGRKGAGIYKKMMATDEQVKAVMHFRRSAITARDYTFEVPEELGLSDEEAELRVAVFERALEVTEGSFRDALNGIMSAQQNGCSFTEMVFGQFDLRGTPWIGVECFKLRPFDTFEFKVDPHGNVLELTQRIGGQVIPVPYEKVIHFVQNPDVDEHYGQSDLRAAYRPYFSKDICIRTWNVFLERHAGGFTTITPTGDVTVPQGSPAETALQNMIENVQSRTGMLLPRGFDLKLVFPGTTDAFEKAVQAHDKAIAKALLVPNLLGMSEQGSVGSYSQSQTQLEAFLWTLEGDKGRMEEALNEQLFSVLGDLNWGDGRYPLFKFSPVSDAMKRGIIETWVNAVTGGAVRPTDTDEEFIREMLRFPGRGEPLQGAPPVPPAGAQPTDSPTGAEPRTDQPGVGGVPDESTIVGRAWTEVSAKLTRAQRRVDFKVIESRSEGLIADATDEAARLMSAGVRDVLRRAEKLKDASGVEELAFDVDDLRASLRETLSDAWRLGVDHAKKEITKAKGERFAAGFKALSDEAARAYFETRAYTIAGNLSDAALATIRNGVLNGIKAGKGVSEVEKDIYRDLAASGLISEEEAKRQLGTAIGVADASSRIRNVIRTGTFEAVNEARYDFFTAPELGGYVEALEYSAVLDSRTTAVCRSLDGAVYPADDEIWDSYRPPNHYQCRSILIAVTQDDTWEKSEAPDVEPQKGFSRRG